MKLTHVASDMARVVVVENVRYEDIMAAFSQLLDKKRSDSAEAASDEDAFWLHHFSDLALIC